jgi:hypothetical protein
MFTIKWIAANGSEMLYRGMDVSFTPADQRGDGVKAGGYERPVVSFQVDSGVQCSIDSGAVYVMNDAGKTVASYIISTQDFPRGIMPHAA